MYHVKWKYEMMVEIKWKEGKVDGEEKKENCD
jgi:hypothetical protein